MKEQKVKNKNKRSAIMVNNLGVLIQYLSNFSLLPGDLFTLWSRLFVFFAIARSSFLKQPLEKVANSLIFSLYMAVYALQMQENKNNDFQNVSFAILMLK